MTKRRVWAWILGVLVAGSLLGFGAWTYFDSSNRSEWGTVWGALGQWAGGIGTILAVIFTVRYARRDAARTQDRWQRDAEVAQARWTSDTEIDRAKWRHDLAMAEERWLAEIVDRDRRESRAAEELAHKYARLVLVSVDERTDAASGGTDLFVTISNHSPEPVLYPRLEAFVHPGGGTAAWTITNPELFGDFWTPPDWIAAGGATTLAVEIKYDPKPTREQFAAQRGPIPIIVYEDADGRRWRRTATYEPVPRPEDDDVILRGPAWYR